MEIQLMTYIFGAAVLTVVAAALLLPVFFTVEQRRAAAVQRLGGFMREAGPGARVKVPFLVRGIGRVSLRVQQLDIDAKTEDNAFIRMVGPRRNSAPSPSGSSGRADAWSPTREARHE